MTDKFISDTNDVGYIKNFNDYPENSISEIITNGFFTVDKQWKVISWNKAAEKLLRVTVRDIVGKNLWEAFAETLPADFYTTYHKAQLKDIPAHFKKFWPAMNTWFDVFTFYWDSNLSVSFKSSMPIQTERPPKQLKILNELYKFVTEVTNDCLWEWDLQSKELFWIDGGHKRIFGYQIENTLIPQSFWENRVHPEEKTRVLAGLKKIINESVNPVWEDEYRFRKADGEYAYVHDRGHIFRDAGNVTIRMIGATQDITARKLSEIQLLNERQSRQRENTRAIITAQENERANIGRELHDNLNQVLAVTKLYIQMAASGKGDKEKYLDKSTILITKVIEEVRKISKTMVIPGVNGISLFDNIKNLIDDLNIHPVDIEFRTEGIEIKDLDQKLQLNIFRIIQEQVINILKHSEAKQASINLSKNKDGIILLITDDGIGCDTSEISKGVGIRNIISRAEICGGKAEIESAPGQGFRLKVNFEYPQ